MSEADENMVDVEVNGVPVKARRGQMIIEATDAIDVYVPRFCYHRKLSIAANCRMCLVDVEKAPKPLPACATPVAQGMKIFTRSERALSAQKATMEFLLINHPLDCPICDQGGECELQDLAVGFGRGVSRYAERKRVVKDMNLGPLVSTDMTRCIHCTRCVRFGQEIAGIQELGTIGRSEDMEIGTFIEKSVDHELSGNIIDLCPVGALNNKPYRFSARAWEMIERKLVSPHDCAGSNLHAHVLRGELRRIVPCENDAINETWISDRDRFSCFGIRSEDRLERPMIKHDHEWKEVEWQEALEYAVKGVTASVGGEGEVLGVLANPSSTVEELYLLRRIADSLGSRNIDHRLRRSDFRDQDNDPPWPSLGSTIAGIDRRDGILVVGSNLRMEVPIIAHRIRKAALAGAAVAFVNPIDYEMLHPVTAFVDAPLPDFVLHFAGVLVAAAEALKKSLPDDVPKSLIAEFKKIKPSDAQRAAAGALIDKNEPWLVLGQLALRHPRYSEIRAIAATLATITGASLGYLSEGSNSAGAAMLGFLPNRDINGTASQTAGYGSATMLESPRRAYVLLGIEPERDLANGDTAAAALQSADIVVALTAFVTDELLDCTNVLLPIGTFAETEGTYVNAEGRAQSFGAAAECMGDARPAWRVLRVLGNQFGVENCEYQSIEDVRTEVANLIGIFGDADSDFAAAMPTQQAFAQCDFDLNPVDVEIDELDVPIYAIDALVRRSEPLQQTITALESDGDASFDLRSA
jgi:NADH-quinone oxidoreductase subunit G